MVIIHFSRTGDQEVTKLMLLPDLVALYPVPFPLSLMHLRPEGMIVEEWSEYALSYHCIPTLKTFYPLPES